MEGKPVVVILDLDNKMTSGEQKKILNLEKRGVNRSLEAVNFTTIVYEFSLSAKTTGYFRSLPKLTEYYCIPSLYMTSRLQY